MARKCKRYRTKKIIQDYGPAKRVRVCASYGSARKGKRRGKRRHKWCVFKGKRKGMMQSCHPSKRTAKHAAAVLRRTCRARIRVKRMKKAA